MTDYAELRSAIAPEAVRAALAARADELATASHPHHIGSMADVREAEYRGHRIEVRTSYAITVDGRPFDVHVVVDNEGRVFYHGMPTRDFASVIDLVKKVVDQFPADFRPRAEPGGTSHGHEHGPGRKHVDESEQHGHVHGEGS
jgi:hypothetical protein